MREQTIGNVLQRAEAAYAEMTREIVFMDDAIASTAAQRNRLVSEREELAGHIEWLQLLIEGNAGRDEITSAAQMAREAIFSEVESDDGKR